MNPLRAALTVALCLPVTLALADDMPATALAAPAASPVSPAEPAPEGNAGADWNVNSRYTVESVEFTDTEESDFSHRLREQIHQIAGDKLNVAALRTLARDIRSELNVHAVSFRIARGSRPDYVRVFFDVDRTHSTFDVSVPRFVWESGEGWTGIGEATLTVGRNSATLGLLSDGDDLIERYSGVRASFAHKWGTDHPFRLVFAFEDYHDEFGRE